MFLLRIYQIYHQMSNCFIRILQEQMYTVCTCMHCSATPWTVSSQKRYHQTVHSKKIGPTWPNITAIPSPPYVYTVRKWRPSKQAAAAVAVNGIWLGWTSSSKDATYHWTCALRYTLCSMLLFRALHVIAHARISYTVKPHFTVTW